MEFIKCKKVLYEALGKPHIAYADEFYTMDEAVGLIRQINPTALVLRMSDTEVSLDEYHQLNVSNIAKWLDDINKYENEQ